MKINRGKCKISKGIKRVKKKQLRQESRCLKAGQPGSITKIRLP
jgi:hypothetical protein